MNILEHETRKLETGYEVPLLWKEKEPQLQNNREVAQKRLEGLQRRFERDPEYEKDCRKVVSKYVEDGYAHKVGEEDDLNGTNQWYLPQHGVYKKSSAEKKIRVVFDDRQVQRQMFERCFTPRTCSTELTPTSSHKVPGR